MGSLDVDATFKDSPSSFSPPLRGEGGGHRRGRRARRQRERGEGEQGRGRTKRPPRGEDEVSVLACEDG